MRVFAIVPAAGLSRRMGGLHKLLLPWREATIIDAVLQAWTRSDVDHVWIVCRGADSLLHAACRRWPVTLVTPPDDPTDMKASVLAGLQQIAEQHQPAEHDRWLVAPADIPQLGVLTINRLVLAGVNATDHTGDGEPRPIIAPRYGSRPGHPVSYPWSLAAAVSQIPSDQGLNWLVSRYSCRWLDLPADQRPGDIDTPADYKRLGRPEPPT